MLFSKAALAAAFVTFMVFVDAKDVTCKKGKMTAQVTLNEGDTFSFRSIRSGVYGGRQRCRVNYKLGKCSAASVSCSKFDLKADKICRTGDSITINSRGSQPKKFCQSKGPKDVSFKKPFSVFFKSNKWKGGHFKCEVSCTAGPPLPRMIVTNPMENEIFSVNLDNGEICDIPLYPGAEASKLSAAIAYIDSIGKPVVVKQCDGPGMCDTYAFNGTGWEPLNQPTGNYSSAWFTHSVMRGNEWWVSGLDAEPSWPNGTWDTTVYTSEIFDGSTWREGPQYSSDIPIYACTAQLDDATTLVTGGYDKLYLNEPFQGVSYPINNVSVYDWTSSTWMESAPLNESRFFHGCALLEGQGVLVAGGLGEYNPLVSVELFDIQSKMWIEQPPLPSFPFTPLLLSWGTTVIHPTETMVYKRAENGTWAPIEGITLPTFVDGYFNRAFLIPDEFDLQCTPPSRTVNRLTKEERDQIYQEKLKSMMPSQLAGSLTV